MLGRSRIDSFFVDLGPWTPRGECPLRRTELLPWGQLSTERKPLVALRQISCKKKV